MEGVKHSRISCLNLSDLAGVYSWPSQMFLSFSSLSQWQYMKSRGGWSRGIFSFCAFWTFATEKAPRVFWKDYSSPPPARAIQGSLSASCQEILVGFYIEPGVSGLPKIRAPRSVHSHIIPHSSPVLCLVTQSCLTLCNPRDYSPPGSSLHGDSPGKNTGVDCPFQGIFLTQGSNPGLLHCNTWILYEFFTIWA